MKVHIETGGNESVSSTPVPQIVPTAAPINRLSVTQYLKSKQDQGKPKPETQVVDDFDADKFLDKRQKKFLKKWDLICSEGTFQKSVLVEEKFPYFVNKPKVPFGLKDCQEMNMRVGISQDSKPIKVIDKVNGVYTCTICDVVILDRYSLQDHWYSAKHKQSMTQVQVIAGLEERLAMNRPVVQEMLDQFHLCPLLGLDQVVEVLQGDQPPLYHCSLCNIDLTQNDLMLHLTSLNHLLTFIKQYFPVAWARFSSLTDFGAWLKSDFDCLEIVVNKIDQVHGRKKPLIVENRIKMSEALDKISSNSYNARRTEVDTYFNKTLTPIEPRKPIKKPTPSTKPPIPTKPKKRLVTRQPGIMTEKIELKPKESISTEIKILENPVNLMGTKFVKVSQAAGYGGPVRLKSSFSRIWVDNQTVFVRAIIINTLNYNVTIVKGTEVATITFSLSC